MSYTLRRRLYGYGVVREVHADGGAVESSEPAPRRFAFGRRADLLGNGDSCCERFAPGERVLMAVDMAFNAPPAVLTVVPERDFDRLRFDAARVLRVLTVPHSNKRVAVLRACNATDRCEHLILLTSSSYLAKGKVAAKTTIMEQYMFENENFPNTLTTGSLREGHCVAVNAVPIPPLGDEHTSANPFDRQFACAGTAGAALFAFQYSHEADGGPLWRQWDCQWPARAPREWHWEHVSARGGAEERPAKETAAIVLPISHKQQEVREATSRTPVTKPAVHKAARKRDATVQTEGVDGSVAEFTSRCRQNSELLALVRNRLGDAFLRKYRLAE